MAKDYKALLVDDERLSRNDLRLLLENHKQITVIGEASNAEDGLQKIDELKPDLVFLDIQMPGMNGFDMLEHINSDIHVIFVTAFDEYALRAFEVNALDYLLKPVNPERLQQSIERLEQIPEELEESDLRELEYNDRLLLKLDTSLGFLKVSTIICITSAGDYSELLCTNKKKVLVHKSMAEWESRLPATFFNRIHRTTIVNMEYVDRLEEWFNNSYRVYMKGVEEPYVMSRRYVAKLKQKMS
ncbi:MAG: LytTR family DNA-binding domain-containing protein [Candidatus Marinimicrobia bacterium]|nr:LytTR family DNA-binding domain-containing protein [Candidatus Neomarinimicrobiota bacterium]MCF7850291.1 LytTR family DNA-binding domain-containing protein [Candidatus Neomarinimicrobiota bacterium]MCF7903812.1 LytTR family DNA-binding domain-containing protein [Candidatus Neomarinimicrobiota bacterium]